MKRSLPYPIPIQIISYCCCSEISAQRGYSTRSVGAHSTKMPVGVRSKISWQNKSVISQILKICIHTVVRLLMFPSVIPNPSPFLLFLLPLPEPPPLMRIVSRVWMRVTRHEWTRPGTGAVSIMDVMWKERCGYMW